MLKVKQGLNGVGGSRNPAAAGPAFSGVKPCGVWVQGLRSWCVGTAARFASFCPISGGHSQPQVMIDSSG